jgi:hypothetical protein
MQAQDSLPGDNAMTEHSDRLARLLRLWGRVGFVFFLGIALVLTGIAVIEEQLTARALLVICSLGVLGLVSLGLARIYELIARRLFPKG